MPNRFGTKQNSFGSWIKEKENHSHYINIIRLYEHIHSLLRRFLNRNNKSKSHRRRISSWVSSSNEIDWRSKHVISYVTTHYTHYTWLHMVTRGYTWLHVVTHHQSLYISRSIYASAVDHFIGKSEINTVCMRAISI